MSLSDKMVVNTLTRWQVKRAVKELRDDIRLNISTSIRVDEIIKEVFGEKLI